MAKRLVLIADSPRFLRLLEEHLVKAGYDPFLFTSPETAYGRLGDLQPAAIFVSVRQKNSAADWDLLDTWRIDPLLAGTPLIVSSAEPRHLQDRARHLEEQGHTVLPRPFAPADLLTAVQRVAGGPA